MKYIPYDWTARDMIGGNAALDFINTASRWAGEPVDRLNGPEDFADWAALAGVVDAATSARIKAAARRDPKAALDLYERARRLRAALWRIFSAVQQGRAVDAEDLAILAEWTRRASQYCELHQTGDGFERRWTADAPDMERPLLAIAQAAETLLEQGPLERLHMCGGENCEWLFLDLSKNHSRRWCNMATCGNEAKVKKFRSRQKAHDVA